MELQQDLKLQLSKTNILFAFDDIECERSTSFDIPATPHNNAILEMAKDYHFTGMGMRKRYNAQMQSGVISKNGYLYITEYNASNRVYSAVFVTGELFGLLKLRELGTLREILQDVSLPADWDNVAVNLGDDIEYPSAEIKDFANIFHIDDSGEGRVVPSFSVDAINRLLQGKGIDTLVPSSRGNRLFIKDIKNASGRSVAITAHRTSGQYTPSTSQLDWNILYTHLVSGGNETIFDQALVKGTVKIDDDNNRFYGYVRPLVAKIDMKLKFPEDFPNEYHILTGFDLNMSDGIMSNMEWLGDYSFTRSRIFGSVIIVRDGVPLKGREVQITAGTQLLLLAEDNLSGGWPLNGFDFADDMADRVFNVEIQVNTQLHAPVFAIDNIPDIEYIDWQKTIAALEGKVLSYNEQDGLVAEDMDLSNFPIEPINNVISVDMVRRTFAEYAQHNVVAFEEGETPNATDYTVPNDNIEQENELYTIPLNRGRLGIYGARASIAFDVDEKYGIEQYVMAEQAYGQLVPFVLTKNATIQRLCNVSTQIELSVRMTLLEYEQIKPKMLLYYDGALWIWTEANWSDNVATIKLSKI